MQNKKWLVVICLAAALVLGVVIGVVWTGYRVISQIPGAPGPAIVQQLDEMPDTCKSVEALLTGRMGYYPENSEEASDHIARADIYAVLTERGCPENSDKYKAFALHEIEIARALGDDKHLGERDVLEVVDTYKKLDMEEEARAFIDTIKRITEPAVEFIQAVEKVLEETN